LIVENLPSIFETLGFDHQYKKKKEEKKKGSGIVERLEMGMRSSE
jgi:hypothetical protein